jgi:hypothetical protein
MIRFPNRLGYHISGYENNKKNTDIIKLDPNNIIAIIKNNGVLRFIEGSTQIHYENDDLLIFVITKKSNDNYFFGKKEMEHFNLTFEGDKIKLLDDTYSNMTASINWNELYPNIFDKIRSNLIFKDKKEKIKYGLEREIIRQVNKNYSANEGLKYNLIYDDLYEICWRDRKKIDLLILAGDDWSNTAHRYTKSYNINNKNVLLIKLNRHIFNYNEQGIIWQVRRQKINLYPVIWAVENINILSEIIPSIKKIIFHATALFYYNSQCLFNLFPDKEYILCNGGTTYRESPGRTNNVFGDIVKKYIIQCPDLLNLSPPNIIEKLIYYPIEIDKVKPIYKFLDEKMLRIGHWPSTKSVKGTPIILTVINNLYKLGYKFQYVGVTDLKEKWQKSNDFISWEKNIERMQNVDIYIETINLKINGKKFGEWGNTCLEAAASGCVVCTNCLEQQKYESEYGTKLPLRVSNSGEELQKNLVTLLKMRRDEIMELKKKTRKWAEDFHSIQKTGERLIDFVF